MNRRTEFIGISPSHTRNHATTTPQPNQPTATQLQQQLRAGVQAGGAGHGRTSWVAGHRETSQNTWLVACLVKTSSGRLGDWVTVRQSRERVVVWAYGRVRACVCVRATDYTSSFVCFAASREAHVRRPSSVVRRSLVLRPTVSLRWWSPSRSRQAQVSVRLCHQAFVRVGSWSGPWMSRRCGCGGSDRGMCLAERRCLSILWR